MKKSLFILTLGFLSTLNYAQEKNNIETEKVFRVNFLNPAIDLTYGENGFIYIISPFADFQQKWFYNLNKRNGKNRNTENNSGNFVSLRFITRGNSIAENVNRTSDFDFAFGPTWGIQRKYGKNFHLLFDIGPQYYFDTNGNGNIWPIMLQLNLGFDLKRK
jgi:hypothetical protein